MARNSLMAVILGAALAVAAAFAVTVGVPTADAKSTTWGECVTGDAETTAQLTEFAAYLVSLHCEQEVGT